MENVLAVIMGGGQGTRLYPLTKLRAKPAVPLAAKYRLIDIPISNCINSDIRKIYLLTQFNSASLHRHILQAYNFDHFSNGFVEICAAQQTLEGSTGWYQGTADAVRQNLRYFFDHQPSYVIILSGDQLYRMDFRKVLQQHVETKAEITVAALTVPRKNASSLGILQVNEERRITRFVEKPKEANVLDELRLSGKLKEELSSGGGQDDETFLASMGIYIFDPKVLVDVLNNRKVDFGKDIIPAAIKTHRVFSYIYQGYWEDIGTIGAFFEANLDMTRPNPKFDIYARHYPIYTRARYLPASQMSGGHFNETVIGDGCRIGSNVKLQRTLVGIRSIIQENCDLQDCIVMGSDYFETDAMSEDFKARGVPHIGIGKNCKIRRAILDKNVQIGDDVVISPDGKEDDTDHELYSVRDGIIVIPKNTIIPSGTVL
jgi:glucose-1-phosphate adenylyltransferase